MNLSWIHGGWVGGWWGEPGARNPFTFLTVKGTAREECVSCVCGTWGHLSGQRWDWEPLTQVGLLLRYRHCSVTKSLRPHGLQHARPPCPSPTPRVCPDLCPLSWSCCLTISSSSALFSFCLPSFLASGSSRTFWSILIRNFSLCTISQACGFLRPWMTPSSVENQVFSSAPPVW